jgi:branched-chain amino acid transport system ATP-binding protein
VADDVAHLTSPCLKYWSRWRAECRVFSRLQVTIDTGRPARPLTPAAGTGITMSAVRDGKKGKCVPQKSESQSPNGGTEIVLEARGLKKSFGGIKALDGLTCRLARGHIAGLIGPNGAGKSTCFDVITGVLGAEAGEVLLFGEDITGTATHRLAAKGLVRSFQLAREMAGLSVLENLMLAPLDQTGERLRPLFSKPGTIRDEERAVHTRP